jgi:hypothetical protein
MEESPGSGAVKNQVFELAYWINERYAMKLRKEAADKLRVPGVPNLYDLKYGYSNDPNMGGVRYCNVHREDDLVTKWLAVNWRPRHHRPWEIVLARMINYIPSLEEVVHYLDHKTPGDPLDEVGRCLKDRRTKGEKVFTSAYTISTCGRKVDKIDYVISVASDVKWMARTSHPGDDTLETWHEWLMRVDGLGSFLAAQVVADLKNTEGHALLDAPDWATWAAPGPGSLRGLEAFYGRRIAPSTFRAAIMQCWDEVRPLIPDYIPPIHMQDFQNCLCEFSKYMRVKQGGHARNRYHPG